MTEQALHADAKAKRRSMAITGRAGGIGLLETIQTKKSTVKADALFKLQQVVREQMRCCATDNPSALLFKYLI